MRSSSCCLAKAEGGGVDADGLAALEMGAGLIGRCFAAAEVEGDRLGLVTAPMLENVGRALVRQGTCAYAIEDGPRLTPAVGRPDVRGGDDPDGWVYRLDLARAIAHAVRVDALHKRARVSCERQPRNPLGRAGTP